MPLTTSVTPATIAVELGQSVPASGSTKDLQWAQWIADALVPIQARVDSITPTPTVDQDALDYVIRKAVAAHADRPSDGATQVTTSIDDGSVSKTYRKTRGVDVEITGEWWAMLGLAPTKGKAYNVDLMPPGAGIGGDRLTYWWV